LPDSRFIGGQIVLEFTFYCGSMDRKAYLTSILGRLVNSTASDLQARFIHFF
jgi:hypothetical protein